MMYTLLYHRERKDFSEFMLHHLVTFALVIFSYSINCLPYGAVIMFIHYISDIFISTLRGFMDVVRIELSVFIYGWVILSWIYFRLYYFPFRLLGNLY
jgi:hypothetical protein